MNLADEVAKTLVRIMASELAPWSPTIVSAMEVTPNEDQSRRIVVSCTESKLWKQLLPGIYEVSGEVFIMQSIDTDEPNDELSSMCEAVVDIIGDKRGMPARLMGENFNLSVLTWNMDTQALLGNQRKIAAKYSFTLLASNQPPTNN
jgi:hypothetical protein